MFIRSRVISSRAPNGSSMSRIAGSRESARAMATLLHPARQLPRVVIGEVRQLDEGQVRVRQSVALGLRRPVDLERQFDIGSDRPPIEQDRCLEDHPVVAVQARLVCRLVALTTTVPSDGDVRSPMIRGASTCHSRMGR